MVPVRQISIIQILNVTWAYFFPFRILSLIHLLKSGQVLQLIINATLPYTCSYPRPSANSPGPCLSLPISLSQKYFKTGLHLPLRPGVVVAAAGGWGRVLRLRTLPPHQKKRKIFQEG